MKATRNAMVSPDSRLLCLLAFMFICLDLEVFDRFLVILGFDDGKDVSPREGDVIAAKAREDSRIHWPHDLSAVERNEAMRKSLCF